MNKHFCEKERKEDGKKEVGNSLLSLRDEFRGDTRGLDGDVKKKRKERKGQRSRISEMFPCPMNPPPPNPVEIFSPRSPHPPPSPRPHLSLPNQSYVTRLGFGARNVLT